MPKEDGNISVLNQLVGIKGDSPWKTNRGLSYIAHKFIKEYYSGHEHALPCKSADRECRTPETKQNLSRLTNRRPWHAVCLFPCVK
jgi:hypothetical protein